ncbi:hypothetical protein FRC00_003397 [Tulasnella sp. 408]|nr:hypothetical protein FRC00_003397 [Tulasnella sp. 408]
MLRSACILNYGVQWSTSLFLNLHELVLVDIIQAAPDVDTLLEILSNSPKLTRLRVHGVIFTNSSSSQTRISLSCLRSLELEWLAPHILKQLVDAIDIPTSTKYSFLIVLDDGWYICYERLEPISPRLKALAEVSRGTRSTLTFKVEGDGWNKTVRATYGGEAQQLGAFTVGVETLARSTNIIECFARQLGQGEPNPIPPILHLINCSDGAYGNTKEELLQILHRHLPDTDEILIEDTSSRFIEDAFNDLFPLNQSSGLFSRLSALTEQQDQEGGSYPLPLQTFRIEGGTISAEMVKVLENLVPNLMLDRVKVKD